MQKEGKIFEEKFNYEAEREKLLSAVRRDLEYFFDSSEDGEERVEPLLEKVKDYSGKGLINDDDEFKTMEEGLRKLSAIDNKSEFVEAAIRVLDPFLTAKLNKPKEFEDLERKITLSTGVKLSETLYYRPYLEEGYISIHTPPATTMNIKEKPDYYLEGFAKLVEVLESNPEIKIISAHSWIVAQHPKIFERLGFKIQQIDGEGDRKVGIASAERDDFLNSPWIKKYFKK